MRLRRNDNFTFLATVPSTCCTRFPLPSALQSVDEWRCAVVRSDCHSSSRCAMPSRLRLRLRLLAALQLLSSLLLLLHACHGALTLSPLASHSASVHIERVILQREAPPPAPGDDLRLPPRDAAAATPDARSYHVAVIRVETDEKDEIQTKEQGDEGQWRRETDRQTGGPQRNLASTSRCLALLTLMCHTLGCSFSSPAPVIIVGARFESSGVWRSPHAAVRVIPRAQPPPACAASRNRRGEKATSACSETGTQACGPKQRK